MAATDPITTTNDWLTRTLLVAIGLILPICSCTPTSSSDHLATELIDDSVSVTSAANRGGRLVYALTGEVDSFNPIEARGGTGRQLRSLSFSTLVGLDHETVQLTPELARSWQVSEDRLTWTFFLRQGLQWSDGTALTVEDCLFSFQAIFHPEIQTNVQDGFRDPHSRELPTVQIDSEQQAIIFQLKNSDELFLTRVGMVSIIPQHLWKEHLQQQNPTLLQQMTNAIEPALLVGSGPFSLHRYDPGEKVVYRRNPHYWKKDLDGQQLPYLDEIVVLLVADQNLMWQKFEAGQLDLVMDLTADHFREARALDRIGKAQLFRLGPSLNSIWICFNLHPGTDPKSGDQYVSAEKSVWFQQLDFRRAVQHAIDRDAIIRTAYQGRATPIWSKITPANRRWYHPGLPKPEHSRDKANLLLDQLGWVDTDEDGTREDHQGMPIRFTIHTSSQINIFSKIANQIVQDLAHIGIDVRLDSIPSSEISNRLLNTHRWDMILSGWKSGVPPDPGLGKNVTLSSGRLHLWHPQQSTPATAWETKIDDRMAQMDRESDPAQRKIHFDAVQELISLHVPIIYLVAENSYCITQKNRIGNLKPTILRPQLTWNLDQVWIRR